MKHSMFNGSHEHLFKYSKKKKLKIIKKDVYSTWIHRNFMMLNLKKKLLSHLIAWNSILQIEFSQKRDIPPDTLPSVKCAFNGCKSEWTPRWDAKMARVTRLEENKAFWNIRNAVILCAINLCAFNAEMKLSVKVYDPGLLQGCVAY